MNLSDIQAECGRLLSDPSNTRWVLSVLTSRINLAQTEIQGYTKAVKTNEALTTAGTLNLNANVMDIIRVVMARSDGSSKDLTGISTEELVFRYPNFSQWPSGEPWLFSYDATSQTMNLYPAPDASNSIAGGTTVVEIRKPPDLALSTDIPFNSNNQMVPYHYAIVHWVVAHCFMDDGTPEALAKAKFHRSGNMMRPGEYETELGRIMAEFDTPQDVPGSILWKPQGGRTGSWLSPSKSNPLPW